MVNEKTRDMLSFLANGKNYKKDVNFHLLNNFYNVDHNDIEKYNRLRIKQEYSLKI